MAKLALLLLAALAFQAASAGVRRHHHRRSAEDAHAPDVLLQQIRFAVRDVDLALEKGLPGGTQLANILPWQCRELAQTLDTIIYKLQLQEDVGNVAPVIGELREIQRAFLKMAENTDWVNVEQLKVRFNGCLQNCIEQIEKLMRVVPETQIRTITKDILIDLLTSVRKIQNQVQHVSLQTVEDPKQLSLEVRTVTKTIENTIQTVLLDSQKVKLALREFVHNVEGIITLLQREQGVVSDLEVNAVFQRFTETLRKILITIMQITETYSTGNVEYIRVQLINQLELVAEEIDQLIRYSLTSSKETLVRDIINDYLSALRQLKLQIRDEYQDSMGIPGVESDYGKFMYKYAKKATTSPTKGLTIQIQAVTSDLVQTLQMITVDNLLVRETLVDLIREYQQDLDAIVGKLEQVVYDVAAADKTFQTTVEKLKQVLVMFRQIVGQNVVSVEELKRQLITCVQDITGDLQKLAVVAQTGTKKSTGTLPVIVKNVLVQFLTVTRNLQFQLQNIAQVSQRDETTTDLDARIQTLVNSLAVALESISADNIHVRQLLVQQCRELAQQLNAIVGRLQSEFVGIPTYNTEIFMGVVQNLRQIVAMLNQLVMMENATDVQKLKVQLIVCVQDATTEIQKLMLVAQKYLQGQDFYQGQKINGIVSGVVADFLTTLQHQQIQLQTIYQTGQYGQGAVQVAVQIQTITNNLAIYLRDVASSGQNIEMQMRKLIQVVENIVERLETEVIYTKQISGVSEVMKTLKQIVAFVAQKLEGTTDPAYDLKSQWFIILQNVAIELKKLAWIAQKSDLQLQANLNTVVRSVLIQYLMVLQRVQVGLQGVSQTVQVGQTPRELALQIQIVSDRLSEMLCVVSPDTKYTQTSLLWQIRRFYQIIDSIIEKLQLKGDIKLVQQVLFNLKRIKLMLRESTATGEFLNTQLAVIIKETAIEVQKLIWVSPVDIQGSDITTLVKGILIDFLSLLQNMQIQIQSNIQIVVGGQSPQILAYQVQTVATRLISFLRWTQLQPNTQQLRQTLIIQIGELTQAVENIVQMLHSEIKSFGGKNVALEQIVAELSKISLELQKMGGVEEKVALDDLSTRLIAHIEQVVDEVQRLVWVARAKLQLGNTDGVLNGVFNTLLSTLRNMLIQFQNTQEMGQYGQNIKELANQIQTVTNKLTATLQEMVPGTKLVKQALSIRILAYAWHIRSIVERLETEIAYTSDITAFKQITAELKQTVVALQQLGGAWTTRTSVELRNELSNYVQTINAELQKILLSQTSTVDTAVKSVLIDYLAAVQNLQIQIQSIFVAAEKDLNLQQITIMIKAVIDDISLNIHRLVSSKIADEIITVEARQLVTVIAGIIDKLQTESTTIADDTGILPRIIVQLKQIELGLQQVENTEPIVKKKVLLEVLLQRVVFILEQLCWVTQPDYQAITEYKGTSGIDAKIKELLADFLVAIQNVDIQLRNVLQNEPISPKDGELAILQKTTEQRYLPYGQSIAEIRMVVGKLVEILRTPTITNLDKVLAMQARQFGLTIDAIITQLQSQLTCVGLRDVVDGLRQLQLTLRRLIAYNAFAMMDGQVAAELERSIRIAFAEMQKLVMLTEQDTQCKLATGITGVLDIFLDGVRKIWLQIKGVAGTNVGGLYDYGMYDGNTFGFRLYPDRYGQPLGYGNVYDADLGYGKYDTKYGVGSGLGKYDDATFGKGLSYGKYDTTYGSPLGYEKYGNGIYGTGLGTTPGYSLGYGKFDTKYGTAFGYGKYDDSMYGKGSGYGKFGDAYGSTIGYGKYDDNMYNAGLGYGKYDVKRSISPGHKKYDDVKYGKGYDYGKYDTKYGTTLGYGRFDDNMYGTGLGYGKYDTKYGKTFGYGKYDDSMYGKGLDYGKYDSKYGKTSGYEKYDDSMYGKSLDYGKYDSKYGKTFGYGKYDDSMYGKGLGYGKYDSKYGKTFGYGKYDDSMYAKGLDYGKYDSKYGKTFGYGKYDDSMYGKGLDYGKYDSKYGKTFGYGKYDDSVYGTKLGIYDDQDLQGKLREADKYGLRGNKYMLSSEYGLALKTLTCGQLVAEIRMLTEKISEQLQTTVVGEKQIRQLILYHTTQLVKIIDNMIDRLSVKMTSTIYADENIGLIRQICTNLRRIQLELRRVSSTGVILDIHQIKMQLISNIQGIVSELQKLALACQSDIKLNYTIKGVVIQYLMYLRNIYYQHQYSTPLGVTSSIDDITPQHDIKGQGYLPVEEISIGGKVPMWSTDTWTKTALGDFLNLIRNI